MCFCRENRYAQHGLKDVFNVHTLDLLAVAKSFGFLVPPKVHLRVSLGGKNTRPVPRDEQGHNSHGMSADRPYGVPAAAGAGPRQWSR